MLKIALIGASGKLGQSILKLAKKSPEFHFEQLIAKSQVGKTDLITGLKYQSFEELKPVDLVIEVASANATSATIAWCKQHKARLIIGSTGHDEYQIAEIYEASKELPLFYSENFSVPLWLYLDLVKKMASFTKGSCYIDLIEKHRAEKKDTPSGTAKKIAQTLNMPYKLGAERGLRAQEFLHIHSIRGSDLAIEHELIFGFEHESIQIKHEVFDRSSYAEGALKAINFLQDAASGLYTMSNLLNFYNHG